MRTRFAVALLAALAAGSAIADEPKPSAVKPAVLDDTSLEEVMRANATCTSFTNECEICTRTDAGPKCSTPGIACQPKAWRCELQTAPK